MTIEFQNKYFIQVMQRFQLETIKELAPKLDAANDFCDHANAYGQRAVWSE